NLFKEHGLEESIAFTGHEYDVFADLVLYDMLRAYVRTYFEVKTPNHGQTVDGMPASLPEEQVSGLNSAQREMIYDRFGYDKYRIKTPWRDPTRPPVNNYKDLIRYWKNGQLTYTSPKPLPRPRRI